MLDYGRIIVLLQDSMQSLRRSAVVTAEIDVTEDAVLFGTGSSLDSIGFVTFVTDVEERLSRALGKDIYVVLTDLEELYPGTPQLTAAMFADYLARLANE